MMDRNTENATPYADCQGCHVRPCYCGQYDAQPVPKLSYSTWGEYYAWCVIDNYLANQTEQCIALPRDGKMNQEEIKMNVCKSRTCQVNILPTVSFCRKHKHAPKSAKKSNNTLFDASGRVRPGMGLSRCSKQDAANNHNVTGE
jgi:hypothetical protein